MWTVPPGYHSIMETEAGSRPGEKFDVGKTERLRDGFGLFQWDSPTSGHVEVTAWVLEANLYDAETRVKFWLAVPHSFEDEWVSGDWGSNAGTIVTFEPTTEP